jgi:hypothetical protein
LAFSPIFGVVCLPGGLFWHSVSRGRGGWL